MKGNFYEMPPEDWPVVGDHVSFDLSPSGVSVIRSVCERTSFLQRPDSAKIGAVESGELSAERLKLYRSLSSESRNYEKKKEISKRVKAMKKMKG